MNSESPVATPSHINLTDPGYTAMARTGVMSDGNAPPARAPRNPGAKRNDQGRLLDSGKPTDPHADLDWDHPANSRVEIIDPAKAIVREWKPDGSGLKTKVAIIGFANSTRDDAPYDDPEWSIWGLNQIYRWIPRADRHFEIHANFLDAVVEGTDHMAWLKACPIPIYMTKHHDEIPNSLAYPLDRVSEIVSDYYTSTIAFEIALAIAEGYKTIALYGIDLIVGEEWFYQKACAEYMLGVAVGRGIDVIIPRLSALCKTAYRYGYEKEPNWGPLKLSILQSRISELMDERHKLLTQIHGVEGAIMEAKRWAEFLELSLRGGSIRA